MGDLKNNRHTEYIPEPDDHEEHVDERWLVSYADMMTLLFGLFVLLFSMSTMDPKTADQIKAQAESTFNAEPEKKKETLPPSEDQSKVLEERLRTLETELVLKNAALAAHKDKLIELKSKVAVEKKSREPELEAILLKRELEIKELKAGQIKKPDLKEEVEKLKIERDKLSRQLSSVGNIEQSSIENQKLKTEVEKLKIEMETMSKGQGQVFLAFFINWASKNHDVDLVIKDPLGKVFDFKHREHSNNPGLFTLDTRRGPGVELWQSKDIISGLYEATYSLYNDYGNAEAAPVNAMILTPKGSFALPLSKLDTKTKRRVTVKFEVDKVGNVKIVKGS